MQNTEHTAAPLLVRGGRVHDAVHPEPQQIDLLLENGRIVAMGHELNVPADIAVLDAAGLDIFPGFVDAHTHIGLDGYGIGYEGCDYNEMNDIWTPQLRAIDGINPRDPSFAHAREAGITCVCTGPGSANVLGGTFTAIKTVGERVDNMIVKEAVAMKCAFGENPKRCYKDKCDSTRMSTAAFLRGALASARDYGARKAAANGDVTKMPAYNQKLEALLPVLDHTIPLKAHAHQANDIFTAIRIAKEFDLDAVIIHCTEGHLVTEALHDSGYAASVGPIISARTKPELRNQERYNAARLTEAGVPVAFNTDALVFPIDLLAASAKIAVIDGLPWQKALEALTIRSAEVAGVSDQVGSITVGKRADLLIFDRDPIDLLVKPNAVFVDGICTN